MTLDNLSTTAANGLMQWARNKYGDELLFDGFGSSSMHWAWAVFMLRVSEDRPEWFPKGKWATIQFIEEQLLHEAAVEMGAKI